MSNADLKDIRKRITYSDNGKGRTWCGMDMADLLVLVGMAERYEARGKTIDAMQADIEELGAQLKTAVDALVAMAIDRCGEQHTQGIAQKALEQIRGHYVDSE